MKARSIDKVSVLIGDPLLKIPKKSYKAIQSKWLEDQYKAIFQNGHRFLLTFDKKVQLQVVQVVPISSGGITIKEIFKGAIGHYFFNGDKIIINDDGYIARGKGWVGKINDITYLSDSSAIVTNDVGALKSISPIQILDFNTRYMQTRQIGKIGRASCRERV